MTHSICERCFHYAACSAIDITGSVGNPEHHPENEQCERFVSADTVKIQEKSHWVEETVRWRDGDVHVTYRCAHCGELERVKCYKSKPWDDYYHEHVRDELKLPGYCKNCGSVIIDILVGDSRDYRTKKEDT